MTEYQGNISHEIKSRQYVEQQEIEQELLGEENKNCPEINIKRK
jgi:hypothetical protein